MEIAETLNEFFLNIVPSLKIPPKENYETDVGNDNAPNLNYINKFKNHTSIKVIKNLRKKQEQTFTFNYVSYDVVLNEIMKLQNPTTTHDNDNHVLYLECKLQQDRYGSCIYKLKSKKTEQTTYLGTSKQQTRYRRCF